MEAAEFAAFLNVWKLQTLDGTTKTVRLLPKPLSVHFVGLHCEGRRKAPDGFEVKGLDKTVEVDGTKLTNILPILGEGDVSLAITKASLTLKAGGRQSSLRLIGDVTERQIPKVPRSSVCKIEDAAKFKQAIAFLSECASDEAGSLLLTGIQFKQDGDELRLVATDSLHAAVVRLKLELGSGDYVVPAADLTTAVSLLDDKMALAVDERSIYVFDKATTIRIALLQSGERKYPEIDRLPDRDELTNNIVFPTSEMRQAIKAAKVLGAEENILVRVKSGKVSFVVQEVEVGDFVIDVGDGHEVEDTEIRLGAKQLLPIEHMGESVEMHYGAPGKFVLFDGVDTDFNLWVAPKVRAKA